MERNVIGTGSRLTTNVINVTEPELSGKRVAIVWIQSNKDPNAVVGFYEGKIVYPSQIGQTPPDAQCDARTKNCAQGFMEDCILYMHHKGYSYVAYPATDGRYLALPGINDPIPVSWKMTEDGCIARIPFDSGKSYLTLFPGSDGYIAKSPNPALTKTWSGLPTTKEIALCWVHWTVSKKGFPIGYAYNHIENGVGYEESFQYLKQFHVNFTVSRITVIAENLSAIDSLRAFGVDDSIVIAIKMVEPVDDEISCQRYADNFYVKGTPAGMITIVPKWMLESNANIKVVSDGDSKTLWIIFRGNIY